MISPTASITYAKHRKLLTPEEEELLMREWKATRDTKLLNTIILEYTPIIRKCAKDLSGYDCDPKELYAEGYLALTECAWRFDPDLGWKFSTYAKRWVLGMMYQYVTKNKFIVNACTSSKKKKLFFQMRKFIAQHNKKTNTFDMTEDLAEKLSEMFDLPVQEVLYMNSLFKAPAVSLSEPVSASMNDSSVTTKEDMLVSDTLNPEQENQSNQTLSLHQQIVHDAINKMLTPRERRIYQAQVLSDDDDVVTLQALAGEFNISKERVRQIREMSHEKVVAEIKRRVGRDQAKNLFS